MENIEHIRSRLDIINSIEPLIHALRTISLGAWKSALNRKNNLERFEENLLRIIKESDLTQQENIKLIDKKDQGKILVLFIGSDRGLCGKYNHSLINYFKSELHINYSSYDIGAMGKRISHLLSKAKMSLHLTTDFPNSTCPNYKFALSCIDKFNLTAYQGTEIIYNHYIGASKYVTKSLLISQQSNPIKIKNENENNFKYIIDTDPQITIDTLMQLIYRTRIYRCLVHATASEHSTRFNILEEASRNIDQLTITLTNKIQEHRRNKITKEIYDLATAAGLISTRK